jgi:hypothetical protein
VCNMLDLSTGVGEIAATTGPEPSDDLPHQRRSDRGGSGPSELGSIVARRSFPSGKADVDGMTAIWGKADTAEFQGLAKR